MEVIAASKLSRAEFLPGKVSVKEECLVVVVVVVVESSLMVRSQR